MKVLAISGSLRSSSSTGALLRAATQLGAPDMTFDLYESVGALPHFSPDLDVEPLPEPVAELRARIARSDALLIVSPEYAHGMPGSLKNALDWLVSDTLAFGRPTLLDEDVALPLRAAHDEHGAGGRRRPRVQPIQAEPARRGLRPRAARRAARGAGAAGGDAGDAAGR